MNIPEAAIEAAAEKFRESILSRSHNPEDDIFVIDQPSQGSLYIDGDLRIDTLARAALEAAMPAIREALAQEIRQHMRINPSMTADDALALVLGGTA